MEQEGVEEIKIIPSFNLKQLYLRVIRKSGERPLSAIDLMHSLCARTKGTSCPGLQGAERTLLSGLKGRDPAEDF